MPASSQKKHQVPSSADAVADSAEPTPSRRKPKKAPLAVVLVDQGFFTDIEEARRWVMAGKVLVNDRPLDKPGMSVPTDARLRIRGRKHYASRGGYKLEAVLAHFDVAVTGQVALDCGASSGGFTDCLLQHGAHLVYAVDVGYGQLLGRLRADPRVRNLERTNLSDLNREILVPPPTLITLDLSYLSLTTALPLATRLLAPPGHIIALVKPLFEVASVQARRSGRIEDPVLVRDALRQVIATGEGCGLVVQGVVKLALQPRHGVHEFVIVFGQDVGGAPGVVDLVTLEAIIAGEGIGRRVED